MDNILAFIDSLAHAETAPDAFNEYAYKDDNNAIRRANLLRYLTTMQARKPTVLLVMEAPGYRGCRLTGVPVTSRKVLLEGVASLGMFGSDNGYQNTDDKGFERIYAEQSATIVWGTLADLEIAPLIWNAFPFHPHQLGEPLTNRTPRKPEMAMGAGSLRQMLDLFQPQTTIAVGNVAHDVLRSLSVKAVKVRHPAQGGKNAFVAGLTQILS